MRHRTWLRTRLYIIPVALLLALTLPHLDQGDFRTDTGWYSAIGLSTVRHLPEAHSIGDFFTLQAEPGKPFFNKPPLPLWIHGVVLHIFGISLAAARLPTIAAACGCVALTVAIVRRFGTRSQAMIAGVALALTMEFFRRTKEVSLDMWQLLFMLAAVLITVRSLRENRGVEHTSVGVRSAVIPGVLIGLSLLCKPLVGLLASVILLAWLISERKATARWTIAHILAIVAVASPWYVLMSIEHGSAFLSRHFVGEVAERAAGTMTASPTSDGAEPPWFYIMLIGQSYWPWLLTMTLGIIALCRREFSRTARSLAILSVLWFAAWLVLLTAFPDRRPRYALVLWPAGAMLSGLWLGLAPARVLRPLVRALAAWGAPLAIAGGILFAALPVRVQNPPNPQWPALFEWMEANNVDELWQGGFSGPSGSRLYLSYAKWPRPTQDRQNAIVTPPPDGALLIYHRRDGYAPGPREETVFTSGDLTVTRLVSGPWTPVRTTDPGETE